MQNNELKSKIKDFEIKILSSKKIFIIPHINADGDAIGSSLALYIILKKIGKVARLISPSNYPDFLKWMPENNIIQIYQKNDKNIFLEADLIIAIDFNNINRIGKMSEFYIKSKAYKILIDHHPENKPFSDLIFSDVNYSSTAELTYDILINSTFAKHIDKDCATCLYAGIMTDTGCFSFNSSNPNTFRVVADLLEKNIEKDMIFSKTYENFTFNRMQLLGNSLLNRMTYLSEYKAAYIVVLKEDREKFKEKIGDTENFVNYPLSISNCVLSAIFIERNNFIKISFRSKGNFSVEDFAKKYFNGGGHKNASGGESNKPMKETVKKFVDLLEKYKNELNLNLS